MTCGSHFLTEKGPKMSSQNGTNGSAANSIPTLETASAMAATDYLPKASKLRQLKAMMDLQDWRVLQRDDREAVRRYRNKTVFGDSDPSHSQEPDMGDILIADNITIGAQSPAAQVVPTPAQAAAPTPSAVSPQPETSGLSTFAKAGIVAALLASGAGAGAGVPWLLGAFNKQQAAVVQPAQDEDTWQTVRLKLPAVESQP